ncbi:MAG: hypothetical protein RL065_1701, partial [Bacteroidota bacterium]
MLKTTEQSSLYNNLEQKSTIDLLRYINTEDKKVPYAIAEKLNEIELLVDAV